MSDIVLIVNGTRYEGWKAVEVSNSLDQICGTFSLAVSDKYPGKPQEWGFKLGDECIVKISNEPVITGWIEEVITSYGKREHTIQINGRDKTCDLVDCTYQGTPNEWKGISVVEIISNLCARFGLEILTDFSVMERASTIVEEFKASEGATAFELISRLCETYALLPISRGDGILTLTEAGTSLAHDSLQSGKNILTARFEQSNIDRYSNYYVKGTARGNDNKLLEVYIRPVGEATDSVITRSRPLVILAETAIDSGYAKKQAHWEASRRAGQSRKFEYEVVGWLQSNGDIWKLNSLVSVADFVFNVMNTLLISKVVYSLSLETGSTTKMTLVDKSAYSLTEQPIEISGGFD